MATQAKTLKPDGKNNHEKNDDEQAGKFTPRETPETLSQLKIALAVNRNGPV